jgi:hypothetical protein
MGWPYGPGALREGPYGPGALWSRAVRVVAGLPT